MRRYFFNLTGVPYKLDEEGTEFKDDLTAKRHGIICAGQILLDNPGAFVGGQDLKLEVANERGVVLCSINVCVKPVEVVETLV